MIPLRSFLAALVLLSVNLLSTGPVWAQVNIQQPQSTFNGPSKALTKIVKIIDQVAIIIPGHGFNSVQIDDRFEKLFALWGKPLKTKKTGLINKRLHWFYQLDRNSTIEFEGQKVIAKIHVYADHRTIIKTLEGINFSSSPSDVIRLYGKPATNKDNSLFYPRLGIRFSFKKTNDSATSLKQIDVFKAEKA